MAGVAFVGTGAVTAGDQRAFAGEPREDAVVVAVRVTDREIGRGRSVCLADDVELHVPTPRAGFPATASAADCRGSWKVGERLTVQRRPDARVYLAPLTPTDTLALMASAGTLVVVGGVAWRLLAAWGGLILDGVAGYRSRRRGRRHRYVPPSRRPGGRGRRVLR